MKKDKNTPTSSTSSKYTCLISNISELVRLKDFSFDSILDSIVVMYFGAPLCIFIKRRKLETALLCYHILSN